MVYWFLMCISLGMSVTNIHGTNYTFCDDNRRDLTHKKEYILRKTKANWFRANELCLLEGTRLATISDKTENNRLKTMLDKDLDSYLQQVWIGASDLSAQKRFTWSSGHYPTFTQWANEQPNRWKNQEHCVEFITWAGWNDLNCNYEMYFVCESCKQK